MRVGMGSGVVMVVLEREVVLMVLELRCEWWWCSDDGGGFKL